MNSQKKYDRETRKDEEPPSLVDQFFATFSFLSFFFTFTNPSKYQVLEQKQIENQN